MIRPLIVRQKKARDKAFNRFAGAYLGMGHCAMTPLFDSTF